MVPLCLEKSVVATIPLVKPRLLIYLLAGMLLLMVFILLAPESLHSNLGMLQITGSLLALIMLSLGVVLIHLTGKRLARLAAVAEAIGQGQYYTRSTDTHDDAIGQLARAINRMAAEIQSAVSRLERQQTDLSRAYHTVQLQAQDLEVINRQLLALDRQRTEFIATVSHELRTPLNSIIGFSSVLLRNSRQHLPERDLDHLGKIHRNGKHLLGLINNILELAKTETGKLQPMVRLLDPVLVVSEVVEMLQPQATAKQLYLQLNINGAPPSIATDPDKLEQILVNLIGNAIKFTQEGGVSVQLDTTVDQQLRIEIEDTGIGIAEEQLQFIFEPFRQADSGINRRYEGSGLGLTIARNLIALLGGIIAVESRPAVGSRFWIQLPLDPVDNLSSGLPTTFSIADRNLS